MCFADKLLNLRKSKGISQEELAEKLNVSRQAISRWEMGTAQPDAQNVLHISKLFGVTTDYLLNDDFESDKDLPVVQNAEQETVKLFSKKRQLHLVAAICFTVSWFCAFMGLLNSSSDTQMGLSVFSMVLCAGCAVAQYVLYFKKK